LATLPLLLLVVVIATTITAATAAIITTTTRQVLARGEDDAAGRGSPGSDTKVPQRLSRVNVSVWRVSSLLQIIYAPQLQLLLLHDWTIEQSFLNSPFTGKSSSHIVMFIIMCISSSSSASPPLPPRP
jgi:hypothetical protein